MENSDSFIRSAKVRTENRPAFRFIANVMELIESGDLSYVFGDPELRTVVGLDVERANEIVEEFRENRVNYRVVRTLRNFVDFVCAGGFPHSEILKSLRTESEHIVEPTGDELSLAERLAIAPKNIESYFPKTLRDSDAHMLPSHCSHLYVNSDNASLIHDHDLEGFGVVIEDTSLTRLRALLTTASGIKLRKVEMACLEGAGLVSLSLGEVTSDLILPEFNKISHIHFHNFLGGSVKNCHSAEYIRIDRIIGDQVKNISYCEDIDTLDIVCEDILAIKDLMSFDRVKSLRIICPQVTGYEDLRYLTNLKQLEIYSKSPVPLVALEGLNNLLSLVVTGIVENNETGSVLRKLQSLRQFSVYNLKITEDLLQSLYFLSDNYLEYFNVRRPTIRDDKNLKRIYNAMIDKRPKRSFYATYNMRRFPWD